MGVSIFCVSLKNSIIARVFATVSSQENKERTHTRDAWEHRNIYFHYYFKCTDRCIMVSHVYSYSYIYFNENRRERHAVIDHFTIARTSYVYATPE